MNRRVSQSRVSNANERHKECKVAGERLVRSLDINGHTKRRGNHAEDLEDMQATRCDAMRNANLFNSLMGNLSIRLVVLNNTPHRCWRVNLRNTNTK